MSTTRSIQPHLPIAALYRHWETYLDKPIHHEEVSSSVSDALELLGPVELATMRIVGVPANSLDPTVSGQTAEAAIRLSIWRDNGTRLSGYAMANGLQRLFRPAGRPGRRPWFGLRVLYAVDVSEQHHGVRVWVDGPDPDNPRHYRPIRLSDRVAELAAESYGTRSEREEQPA